MHRRPFPQGRTFLLLTVLVVLVVQISKTSFINAIIQNWNAIQVVKVWGALEIVGLGHKDALQDGIPDGWNVHFWGGARQVYHLEEQDSLVGERAVIIERTNDQGVASLTQRVPAYPGDRLVARVYAKGWGAIQLRFREEVSGSWIAKGWCDIPHSDGWQQYQIEVVVPVGVDQAALYLRAGEVLFDEAYVGIKTNDDFGPNLLVNPGFEQDGILEDPLQWWQAHIVQPAALSVPKGELPERIGYQNIVDMLTGRYEVIRMRAASLGNRCASSSDMTGWLLALGDRFEDHGGVTAREQLYQLAIELAPSCPQPYVALARLYESHQAFLRATELYRQAANLSGEYPQAGGYYFEEGFLHVRYTGDWEQAVFVLLKAEQISGWEGGAWYKGVATLNLGIALEALGRFGEAADAYQRVIVCQGCQYHHPEARRRLEELARLKD